LGHVSAYGSVMSLEQAHLEHVEVPDVDDDAEIDPWWQASREGWTLPMAYLPPAMGGRQAGWRKVAAWVLISVFLTATTGGICLTYGPGH